VLFRSERAARGADAREFPHGDALGADEANYDGTYDKDPAAMGPDEVGSHSASASPFGVEDLAGNAWEWTRSALEEGYVARGGSYYYGLNTARTTERAVTEPSFRDASVGLRICADVRPARGE
jgi:eukaryotic-like serine/threonine-protein kinase